jgi:hypothetical protein
VYAIGYNFCDETENLPKNRFPVAKQRLVTLGKELQDFRTVVEYNLDVHGHLHLLPRLNIQNNHDNRPILDDFESDDVQLLWTVNYFDKNDPAIQTETFMITAASPDLETAFYSLQKRRESEDPNRQSYLSLTAVRRSDLNELIPSEAGSKYQPAGGGMLEYMNPNNGTFSVLTLAAAYYSPQEGFRIVQNPEPRIHHSEKYRSQLQRMQVLNAQAMPDASDFQAAIDTITTEIGYETEEASQDDIARVIAQLTHVQSLLSDTRALPPAHFERRDEFGHLGNTVLSLVKTGRDLVASSISDAVYLQQMSRLISTTIATLKNPVAEVLSIPSDQDLMRQQPSSSSSSSQTGSVFNMDSAAASSVPVMPQEPVKYIMVDHGGVLDGTMRLGEADLAAYRGYISEQEIALLRIQPSDLIYRDQSAGIKVMPNGKQLIEDLNELIHEHGYRFVFHSANSERDQLEEYKKFRELCNDNGLACPPLHAMVVLNEANYSRTSSADPAISYVGDVRIGTFGADSQNGKRSVRRALEATLSISPESRGQHIVLDDGEPLVNASREEGYRAFLISNPQLGHTLADAVHQIVLEARAARLAQAPVQSAPLSVNSSSNSATFFQRATFDRQERPLWSQQNFDNLPLPAKAFISQKVEPITSMFGCSTFDYWGQITEDLRKVLIEEYNTADASQSFKFQR